MSQKIFQVDAFTSEPYKGNPAGVCLLPSAKDDAWMQSIASEMNLAETAFLVRDESDENTFDLRWFTPTLEVDLCGHATLASAHIIWQENAAPNGSRLSFKTRSGVLTARQDGDWIEMDFPAEPAEEESAYPKDLAEALNTEPRFVGRNRMDFLVEVGSESVLRGLEPDMRALKRFRQRGVIVTSRSENEKYDFVSRFFAPGSGVDEDPVTGSAHCALAPFWQSRLGRNEMLGYQASPRGGEVRVRVDGDRVLLGGQAVTVLRGELV